VLSISATNVPAANGAIVPLFSMDPSRVCKPRDTWFNAAVSVTLVSFYMTLMLCVFAAGWLIHSQPGRAA
jgi:hypothetical protein